MKRFLSLLMTVLLAHLSRSQQILSLDKPPASPELLPSWINSSASERDFALSPDGQELFFTLQGPRNTIQTLVYCQRLSNGDWSKPVIAPFAGHYSDLEPAFSADGKKLYFSSNRPLKGDQPKDFDIWSVEKVQGHWAEPVNIGAPVNTSSDEFYPSVTNSGNLYFTAAYAGGVGKEDIYIARWDKDHYVQPEALGSEINSRTYEFNAFVLPDESLIIFTSYGRADDMGGGDLYFSKKDAQGQWQEARHLDKLSSSKLDYCPFVSFDGKVLFFTSERNDLKAVYNPQPASYDKLIKELTGPLNSNGNIYWIGMEATGMK